MLSVHRVDSCHMCFGMQPILGLAQDLHEAYLLALDNFTEDIDPRSTGKRDSRFIVYAFGEDGKPNDCVAFDLTKGRNTYEYDLEIIPTSDYEIDLRFGF